MKTIHLCFLWHMHQPYYTDPVAGTASMPWVRLHASKAYFDMAVLLERFPSVKATFNFTPSLLLQLKELASGSVRDLFLDYARRPAADLSSAERAFLIRHFFAANWDTLIRPFPRYHDLLNKRGTDPQPQDLDRLARQFTVQELLDLQVWHNLAWCGYGAVARYPRLAALRRKDRGFSEDDKQDVLAIQLQIVGEIIPLYRKLAEAGQIELTTSPFYHPILPLLIDTDFTRRARPDLPLPTRFHAPSDAQAQIHQAVVQHTELFGKAPTGLWPSEGSVCPELIPMLRQEGLRWVATDEGILARSLDMAGQPWQRDAALYKPYRVGPPGDDLAIVFRDRDISDAFGFVYAKTSAEAAVENVLARIHAAAQQAPDDHLLLPIILDGENPWEHYRDGGEGFLSGLYGALAEGNGNDICIVADTVSRSLEALPPTERLEPLHSGSWINADYKIWIGHQEDNRGWDLIRETRARLVEAGNGLSPEQKRSAWEELYAAEGSDWFWWYGDDFSSDYKHEFDRLFRTHLRNVYTRAGLPAPDFLNEPLIGQSEAQPVSFPVSLLTPTIDGLVTSFFEWRGGGTIDPAPPLGAMWKSTKLFTYIGFGFSLDELFLRLDPDEQALAGLAEAAMDIQIATVSMTHKLSFSLASPNLDTFTLDSAAPGTPLAEVTRYGTICRRKVIELAIPFKALRLQAGEAFSLSLVVTQQGLELERYPRHQPLALTVPDQYFEARTWKV
ncbi:MAG: glycoside hydrolase [Nitrospira sp.]|nr:glycoside hydrolase [Nitrospira sp.]